MTDDWGNQSGLLSEFASYLKTEQARWRTVITEANIRLD